MWIYRGQDLKYVPEDYVLKSGETLATSTKPKRSRKSKAKQQS